MAGGRGRSVTRVVARDQRATHRFDLASGGRLVFGIEKIEVHQARIGVRYALPRGDNMTLRCKALSTPGVP